MRVTVALHAGETIIRTKHLPSKREAALNVTLVGIPVIGDSAIAEHFGDHIARPVQSHSRRAALGEREAKRTPKAVSYTHLRAHETKANLVCRLLLEKK